MPQYVDGFVLPVPKDKVDAYRAIAARAGEVWREYGALDYRECIAENVSIGEVTSFPRSVKAGEDETVVFAWITFESRAHRDEVNKKVMEDPRMDMDPADMPVDMKRLIYGGFEVIVEA